MQFRRIRAQSFKTGHPIYIETHSNGVCCDKIQKHCPLTGPSLGVL